MIKELDKWERKWVEIAEYFSQWSKDTTKIGAVIVDNDWNDLVSFGYNGIPRGVNDNLPERYVRENGEKYFWAAHGERNAIYNAARRGISVKDHTMYLNCYIPCSGCGIAIIQSGIRKVYCKNQDTTGNPDKWSKEAEVTKQMFQESGVDIIFYEDNKSTIEFWFENQKNKF